MTETPIASYIHRLDTRLHSRRRNVIIAGSIFTITLLAFFGRGMLGMIANQREIYLFTIIEIFLGLSFLATWIRYENTISIREFARVLSNNKEETA